jgi:putative aldouronate transport system permease protein
MKIESKIDAQIPQRPSLIKGEWKHLLRSRELIILSIPAVLILFVVCYIPMFGIVIAFKNYRFDQGIFGSAWVGFQNFEFFFKSSDAFRIVRNTLGYNLTFIMLGTLVSVTLAILLNEISRFWVKLYQTILFLPYFLSWVVGGYIVLSFLDSQYGLLNHLLVYWGKQPIDWYSSAQYWPYIIVLMNLWKGVGFSALIYYTGILGIDSEYYEAARIDGANRYQMAMHITVPLLRRLIIILFILAVGNIFRADFGLFYFVPNNSGILYSSTDVMDTYAFRALRALGDIPMSSAVSVFQSVVGLITVLSANFVIKKMDKDAGLF